MEKVLITGATGFVGANVVRLLLERGKSVRALVRPTSDRGNIDDLDVEPIVGDLRDLNSLKAATRGCDSIFHVAAEYNFWSKNPEQTYQSNVDGTRNIMEAALSNNVSKVVYTSTVGTMGLQGQPKPCNESTPMDPGQVTSHYKRSKLAAEEVALSYVEKGVPVIVVNPSAPIGGWDRKPTPTGKIIVDFIKGKMPAYIETGLNIVHVQDVAYGHLLAAEKGKVGERYILGNENMSLGEMLRILSEITGKKSPLFKIPYGFAWTVGLLSTKISDWVTHRPPLVAFEAVKMAKRHMYFDSSKAQSELGLPQTSAHKALEDAVTWFSKHGYC